ncbi:MAG: zf-HC2 domain-containing protein [Terracidiphilus sp.]|jgi:hypothetical protein
MEHSEALEQMVAERYLLNELTAEAREEFEKHLFDCPECALDLRAGAAFVEEAKTQLPELTSARSAPASSRPGELKIKRSWWASMFQPAFAAPVFATLLLIIGYQNLVTYPALRASANQPRLLAWAPLHGSVRGAQLTITADRRHGVALPIDLPAQPSIGAYTSYSFDLYSPQGKLTWTGVIPAPADDASESQRVSLVIPGTTLNSGAYTITVSGVAAQGNRTEIDKYVFNLHLSD